MGPSWLVTTALVAGALRCRADECSDTNGLFYQLRCVKRFWELCADRERWWFGEGWAGRCNGTKRWPECVQPLGPGSEPSDWASLGARLFAQADFRPEEDLRGLAVPLRLASFQAQPIALPRPAVLCNTTGPAPPHEVRVPGALTAKELGCGRSDRSLCTLVYYDVGMGRPLNVWPNWPLNADLSDVNPPTPFAAHASPLVWLVFRQRGVVAGAGKWRQGRGDLPRPFSVRLREVKRELGLEGPFAMALTEAAASLWSVGLHQAAGSLNNCPLLLERRLAEEAGRDSVWATNAHVLLPNGTLPRLALSLRLHYRRPPQQWTLCGNTHRRFAAELWLDGLENAFVSPEDVEMKPRVALEARLAKPSPADFEGRLLSLALVNVEDAAAGEVFVHWLLVDWAPGQEESGRELLGYDVAPSLSVRQYYALAWEQAGRVGGRGAAFLRHGCPEEVVGRCRFPLPAFVEAFGLGLVGLNRFQVPRPQRQPFSRFKLSLRGRNVSSLCAPPTDEGPSAHKARQTPSLSPPSSALQISLSPLLVFHILFISFWIRR